MKKFEGMKALNEEMHELRSKIVAVNYLWQGLFFSLNKVNYSKITTKEREKIKSRFQETAGLLEKTYLQAKEILAQIEEIIRTDDSLYPLVESNIEKIKMFISEVLLNSQATKNNLNDKNCTGILDKLLVQSLLAVFKQLDEKHLPARNALDQIREVLIKEKKYYPQNK